MLPMEKLLEEVDSLPNDEKWRLIEHLLTTLGQMEPIKMEPEDYQQFLIETYGSLRDTPIERWPQGEQPDREPLE